MNEGLCSLEEFPLEPKLKEGVWAPFHFNEKDNHIIDIYLSFIVCGKPTLLDYRSVLISLFEALFDLTGGDASVQ